MSDVVCYSSIKGLEFRATLLDDEFAPVYGDNTVVASDGFVSVSLTDRVFPGLTFELRDVDQRLQVAHADRDDVSWVDVIIELCAVDPAMVTMLTGQRPMLDWKGRVVGFGKRSVQDPPNIGFEVWTEMTAPVDDLGWVYWVLPRLTHCRVSTPILEDGVASFTLTARAFGNASWGVGPHEVVAASDDVLIPSPLLDPLPADEQIAHRLTEVPPPPVSCGLATLWPILPMIVSVWPPDAPDTNTRWMQSDTGHVARWDGSVWLPMSPAADNFAANLGNAILVGALIMVDGDRILIDNTALLIDGD